MNLRNRIYKQPDNTPRVIDIDAEMWSAIKLAASESNWIPKEYYMNDWVADVCNFLRKGA